MSQLPPPLSSKRVLKVGSRKSQLALVQTNEIKRKLEEHGYSVEIIEMTTQGDQILDRPLVQVAKEVGDKGLFTYELERALIEEQIDFAVHSLKDLPTKLIPGLTVGCIGKRVDPRDVVVFNPNHQVQSLADLPSGSVVGTSSLRRVAQLQKKFGTHLSFQSIRGNLNTRLRKLDEGQYAAIILAYAGIQRLGWEHRIGQYLDPNHFKYAVGQGALGIECRANDEELISILKQIIEDPVTAYCCKGERALLRCLEGGCQLPLGVTSDLFVMNTSSCTEATFSPISPDEAHEQYVKTNKIHDLYYQLHAVVLSTDGNVSLQEKVLGPLLLSEQLAISLGQTLLSKGVKQLLH